MTSVKSDTLSVVVKKYQKTQEEVQVKSDYFKLFWDMSDAPSRAVKALLMTTGIKHEGWATERMLKKDQKSAAVEKGIPYLIVD